MVALDFGTAILIFIFCLLSERIDIVLLMGSTMIILYGIQGAYQPAVKASVPILVEKEHIMKANSIVDMVNSIASMAGPVIGGLLLSLFGLNIILYVSIICFLASAIMENFITPKALIGKVVSCFMCVVMCTSPLGQFVYGIIFEHIGSHNYLPFYLAGAIMIGITFMFRHTFDGLDSLAAHQT